jgi:hypothetical protein
MKFDDVTGKSEEKIELETAGVYVEENKEVDGTQLDGACVQSEEKMKLDVIGV